MPRPSHQTVRAAAAALVLAGLLAAAAAATAGDLPGRGAKRPLRSRLVQADWRLWWGTASFGTDGVTLSSEPPTRASETHSALLTSRATFRDVRLTAEIAPLEQLRQNDPPNTWETGWVFLRFRDLENYYYFILKPNGFELGKKQGSDAQIFLATGTLPQLAVPGSASLTITAVGRRIRAFVDGQKIVDYLDPHPLLGSGAVALYEEDATVRFGRVAASAS